MRRPVLGVVTIALAASLVAGCGGSISDEYEVERQPYTLEEVEGEDVLRVILTASAAERLGIETAPVLTRGGRLVVPFDAVFIDSHGGFWVYTSPEPLVYVRAPIEITRESSTEAFLAAGPPAGTEVVTVGVPELYGSESGFDA